MAGFLAGLHERNGTRPQYPPRVLAELVLALGSGVALERIADPGAVPRDAFAQVVHQIAATPADNAAPGQEPATAEPATAEPGTAEPGPAVIPGT